jgi:flagellar motor component MotA
VSSRPKRKARRRYRELVARRETLRESYLSMGRARLEKTINDHIADRFPGTEIRFVIDPTKLETP